MDKSMPYLNAFSIEYVYNVREMINFKTYAWDVTLWCWIAKRFSKFRKEKHHC